MEKVLISLLLSLSIIFSSFFYTYDIIYAATQYENGTINIDVATNLGSFVRMEDYGNYTGRTPEQNGVIRMNDLKFMQYNGMNSKIMRMWLNLADDFVYYDSNGKETTDGGKVVTAKVREDRSTIKHFNETSLYVEELLVCFQHPKIQSGSWSTDGLKKRCAAAMEALVKKYPKCRYFEVENEPDLNDITVEEYYTKYYTPHYEGIWEANRRLGLSGDAELKLGGPVTAMFLPTNDNDYIKKFIKYYAEDPSDKKRLDFISYHDYGGLYKRDPAYFGEQQTLIRNYLSSNHLNPDLPVFISETGMFAGDQSSGLDFSSDLFVVAAGVASMNYHYIDAAHEKGLPQQMFPFMWVPRHTKQDNWRKNMLVTDQLNNSSNAILYKFTPFGNMFKMLAMLREYRIKADVTPKRTGKRGDKDSLGLYALGTKDEHSVAVMMWNFQYNNDSQCAAPFNAGNVVYNVTANINNLDSIPSFKGKDVLVKLYRIDAYSSSYAHRNGSKIDGAITEDSNKKAIINRELINLDGANLVPYEEYITTPVNNSITLNYSFDRNKFRFVELIPVSRKNLALGSKVETSAKGGFPASYAVDGRMDTRWGAPDNTYPYSITSDLGMIADIRGVKISWYNAHERAYKYKIQISNDGTNFNTVIDKTDNTKYGETYDAFECQTRYVRVEVTGCSNQGWASINELEVIANTHNLIHSNITSMEEYKVGKLISGGKTYFQSEQEYNSNPANAFDGQSDTEWKGKNANSGQYVGVDFGYIANLSKIEIDWYNSTGGRSYQYIVEGSIDGKNYVVLANRSDNAEKGKTTDDIPYKARYVRVKVVGSNIGADNIDARIYEIRIYDRPQLHSWQQTAMVEKLVDNQWVVTDSAQNNIVHQMFDGNLDTRWGAKDDYFPYRITLNLGRVYDLSDIEIYWYEGNSGINQRIYRYNIEAGTDGLEYDLIYEGSRNLDIGRTRNAIDTKAQYIRITIWGATDGWASINEMKINGLKPEYIAFSPEFSHEDVGGQYSFSAVTYMENNHLEQIDACLFVAYYDANHNLLDVVSKNKTLLHSEAGFIELQIDDIPKETNYIKSFLWDDFKGLKPLANHNAIKIK